jgi:polyvinyl alcohol dehydrogenase (cytochrome)
MKQRRGVAAVASAAVVAVVVALAAACDHPARVTTGPAPSQRVVSEVPSASRSELADGDWPTYHRDNSRTGVAPSFPALGTLRRAWRAALDGPVYGQPLVIGDAVYAATERDTVYALGADTGRVRWSAHLGQPMRASQLPCGDIDPLGITSTMVYDPATRMVFALAETTGAHHTLFGLDAATGAVKVTRTAEPPKGDPVAQQQRSALTLYNGRVYIAYGGLFGDCGNYIGSVVSIPTVGGAPARSYVVPTTREAGIWAPAGPAVYKGHLLYTVGNGESTSRFDGSDSVIALDPNLRLVDSFAPASWADDNRGDLDLGSMTAVVVNGYVFVAGKRGTGYTLRPDRLGGIGGEVAHMMVCRGFGGAAVDKDVAYVPCPDGTRAVHVDTDGRIQVRWQAPVRADGSPVLGGGALWVVDYDGGTLYALDPASGAVRQQVSVGRSPHFASPTLSAGQVFVGTLTGVTAIRAV